MDKLMIQQWYRTLACLHTTSIKFGKSVMMKLNIYINFNNLMFGK